MGIRFSEEREKEYPLEPLIRITKEYFKLIDMKVGEEFVSRSSKIDSDQIQSYLDKALE